MENKKSEIKPREIVTQTLSRQDEETIRLLTASIEEMLKIWNTSNIPSGVSKKDPKLIPSSKN